MAMKTKSKSRAKTKRSSTSAEARDQELIVIDESAGLIFETEAELSAYFEESIAALESEYQALRTAEDFSDDEQVKLEEFLELTLDEPDEIWRDEKTFKEYPLHIFVKDCEGFFYVVITYLSQDEEEPTFVLSHFPTRDAALVENYERGELLYDRRYESVQPAAVDGDALGEGDPLAVGLFLSMAKLRGEKDIPEKDFQKFANLREETIENPDEIWRKTDLEGQMLVCFIREFPDQEPKDLYYVVLTLEDEENNVHALLFSFPTTDINLVDRYRQGENLQAEEVVQENSH